VAVLRSARSPKIDRRSEEGDSAANRWRLLVPSAFLGQIGSNRGNIENVFAVIIRSRQQFNSVSTFILRNVGKIAEVIPLRESFVSVKRRNECCRADCCVIHQFDTIMPVIMGEWTQRVNQQGVELIVCICVRAEK
jgi:hypothetical protein